MTMRKLSAAIKSTLLGLLAVFAAFGLVVAALIIDAMFAPKSVSGVFWDPVSLWHQSVLGKLFVATLASLPVVIPALIFAFTFTYTYRRFMRHHSTLGQH